VELMEARQQAARVFGVPLDADEHAVKARYRQLAKQVHPDRGGDVEAFRQVHWALNVLLSPLPEQPTGFTVGSDGQAEPVPQQPVRPPEFAPGIEVQAGPVVWLRSRVRFRLVIEVVVVGLVLLGWLVQLAWTTASPLWGLAVVVPVLVRAVWCALGRPESWHMLRTQRSRSTARARAERVEHDPPTEEFPVITEEMMRQHQ